MNANDSISKEKDRHVHNTIVAPAGNREWMTDQVMAVDPNALGRALEPHPVARARGPRAYYPGDVPGGLGSFTRASGGIAVIEIDGPLQQRACWFDGYDAIRARFGAALVDPAVRGVALRLNTPGGVAAGCFEAAAAMRRMADDVGKPVWAFADESAYSAGYALACVADKIYVPRPGGVGSVGVVTCLYDLTKMNEQAGIRVVVLTSGERKADGNPDVLLTGDQIARWQTRTMELANQFAESVAASRKMTAEDVLALQAGVFYGDAAVTAGLADGVSSWDEFIRMLEEKAATASRSTTRRTMSAAAARADQRKRDLMLSTNVIADALGMASTATAEEVNAEVRNIRSNIEQMTSDVGRMLAATGAETVEQALGTLASWKSSSELLASAKEETVRLIKEIESRDRDQLIADNGSKFTPAMKNWARTQSLESLKSFVASAPEIPAFVASGRTQKPSATGPVHEYEGAAEGVAAIASEILEKRWEDLKPMQKQRLHDEAPAIYEHKKKEYQQRTGKAVGARH